MAIGAALMEHGCVGSISVSDKPARPFGQPGAGDAQVSAQSAVTGSIVWPAIALFVLALLVRLLGNSSLPVHRDEFFHFLAAQSWASDGSLAILDGAYPRASGYTVLTGLAFLAADQSSLFIARLPAVLAGTLLVPAVFVWVRRNFTRRAGWMAALLLCFADLSVEVSQFARFYTLQALLLWVGATAIYDALHRGGSIRYSVPWFAVAALCFLAAFHLQVTTLIPLAGLGIYLGGYVLSRPGMSSLLLQKRYRPWLVLTAFALLAGGVAAALSLPVLGEFRKTSLWAQETRDDVLYYVRIFLDRFLILTLIFPVSVWWVLSRRSQAGYFCLALFLVAFAAHSLAGMKSFRYITYAFPYFFVLIAVAMDFLLSALSPIVASGVEFLAGKRRLGRVGASSRPFIQASVLVLIAFVAIAGNRAYAHTFKRIAIDVHRIASRPAAFMQEPPDQPWSGASWRLRAAIGSPSLLVVADDVRTVHYLGPFDLLINRSRITDIEPQVEFGQDFRTGRRVVGSGLTLARVAACYPSGVILVPDDRWELDTAVPPDVRAAIEAVAQPITPGVEGFHLFRWQHAVRQAGCGQLRAKVKDHSM